MPMLMGSSSFVWFNALLLFLLISTHCIATEISYHEHCSSIVPESPITEPEFASLPFPLFQKGYCDGGDRILNPNPSNYSRDNNKFQSFQLQTKHVFKTDLESVFKVEASLIFHIPITNYNGSFSTRQRSRRIDFSFKGFWSEYTGELCMVGQGNLLHLSGVKNSTISSLIRGTLSSVDDQSYFEPISILMFPEKNYQYTKTSNEFKNIAESSSTSSLSLDKVRSICSVLAFPVNKFRLEYASACNFAKTCNPLGDDHVGFLPQLMFLSPTECSPDGQSVRFFIEFPHSSSFDRFQINPFNPNTKFVGEGTWDWKKNRLLVVACRFMKRNSTSLSNSQVGDCSIRMNLRFPAIWSIRNSISISGQIWSNKSVSDIDYFERIMFRSTDNNLLGVPGLKYEYTETNKVRMSCSMKKLVEKSRENFPDGHSIEMSFYTSVGNSKEEFASGYWNPISVGDQIFQGSSESSMPVSKSSLESSDLYANISYKISLILRNDAPRIALFDISSSGSTRVEISAEGIYDAKTGSLCMVGCRYLGLNNQTLKNDLMDCEIHVNLQFPSLNAKKEGVYITGSISSLRDKSDPLHFESIYVSSTSFYTWRFDTEIFMVMITNAIACIFVAFQLLYVERHPGVLPFISLLMLVVLTLGHMMLLLLNFEAWFEAWFFRSQNRQTVLLGSVGWPQVYVAMVVFGLQFRLLKLSWSSRLAFYKSQKASLIVEKKAWYVSLPLYLTGFLISEFVNLGQKNKDVGIAMQSLRLLNMQQHSLWGGLILDGFLFPQILLNILRNSTEKSLSPLFYIGYTLSRVVPHAYDLYRAHNHADNEADFYSIAWNVSIPLGCIFFTVILYFQQRFGGRCFVPRLFREVEGYEKVLAVAGEE